MKRDFPVLVSVTAIHQAPVEWSRVDMQAYRALVEFSEVQHLMHGLFGIHFGGHELVNIKRVSRFEPAKPGRLILIDDAKVLHPQLAMWNSHPAVLIVMVVDLRDLP